MQVGRSVKDRKNWQLITWWFGLNLVDLGLTGLAFSVGAMEGNPLLRAFGVVSFLSILVWKVVMSVGVVWLLRRFDLLRLLCIANLGLLVVCAWNAVMIIGLMGR